MRRMSLPPVVPGEEIVKEGTAYSSNMEKSRGTWGKPGSYLVHPSNGLTEMYKGSQISFFKVIGLEQFYLLNVFKAKICGGQVGYFKSDHHGNNKGIEG